MTEDRILDAVEYTHINLPLAAAPVIRTRSEKFPLTRVIEMASPGTRALPVTLMIGPITKR